MATLYWNKTGVNAHWDTLTDNWWTDDSYSVQASAIPQDGDSVYLRGSTGPDTGPSVAVALALFDTQGLTAASWDVYITNISIQSGGTLTIGDPAAPGNAHAWYGTTAALGAFTFNDGAYNLGTVGDYATFNDNSYSYNTGVVGDHATFNDNAWNGHTVGDYATFNGHSRNDAVYTTGTVGDYATFNTDAGQAGTFTGTTYYVDSALSLTDGTRIAHFTGGGATPVVFVLGASGAVNSVVTSDGSTPIPVIIAPAAMLTDFVGLNILSGKTILGVAGTIPLGNVTTGSGGTLNMGNYTLISGVAAAADVRSTVARYSGGANGTLNNANITVSSGGTLDTAALEAAASLAGADSQLVIDVAAVEAKKDKILTGTTILTVGGTLPASGNTTVYIPSPNMAAACGD